MTDLFVIIFLFPKKRIAQWVFKGFYGLLMFSRVSCFSGFA